MSKEGKNIKHTSEEINRHRSKLYCELKEVDITVKALEYKDADMQRFLRKRNKIDKRLYCGWYF